MGQTDSMGRGESDKNPWGPKITYLSKGINNLGDLVDDLSGDGVDGFGAETVGVHEDVGHAGSVRVHLLHQGEGISGVEVVP